MLFIIIPESKDILSLALEKKWEVCRSQKTSSFVKAHGIVTGSLKEDIIMLLWTS